MARMFETILYGHLIYRPINKKVQWGVPDKNDTLEDFLEWNRKLGGSGQQSGRYAPVVLELVMKVTMDHRIRDNEILEAVEMMKSSLINGVRFNFSQELIRNWMRFGVEVRQINNFEKFDAVLRISRDGVTFRTHDIRADLQIVEELLEGEFDE